MNYVAVLPRSIRARWDRIAIAQLARRAVELDEENRDLRHQLADADDCARMWQDIATIRDEHPNVEIGLTVDGRVVPVEAVRQ